jgi:multiple sugar transport system substrate-binding protein
MIGVNKSMSRRDALKVAGLAGVGSMLGRESSLAAPASLSLMHESCFIGAYDGYFKNALAPAYEKTTGIKIEYELVSVGSLQTRVTSTVEMGAGPDLAELSINWPQLYDEKLVDVSDIAEQIGKMSGGWTDSIKEAVVVNGKWKAIPFGNIGQCMVWRTDWFAEVGFMKFPDTWEELLEAGTKLKKANHPFGFELGHGFGDNHGWLYPLLWSYGAREVEPDGRTIVIDSDETARAVDFCRTFFQQTMFEDVLGWTDASNNKAFLAEQISCTNNAMSILYVAKKDFPDIGKATDHALNPRGPEGRFHITNPWNHSIFTHTRDPKAAKDFLLWLMDPKQVAGWFDIAEGYFAPYLHAYDNAAFWQKEPRYQAFRDSLATSHMLGWPAPGGRQQSESVAKYVVVDMFAKACTGKPTKVVIAEAEDQLKRLYKS